MQKRILKVQMETISTSNSYYGWYAGWKHDINKNEYTIEIRCILNDNGSNI